MSDENMMWFELNEEVLNPQGRGAEQSPLLPNVCICYRSKCLVICRACGFLTNGRVRKRCPLHPKYMFLMDICKCLKCGVFGFMMNEVRK